MMRTADRHSRARTGIPPRSWHTTWRVVPAIAVLGGLAASLSGCSGSLTANSSCQDFLNASQSDQVQAIDQLAAQEDAPDATTPLGMPNVSYLCTEVPSNTLGWAIRETG
jgi:hypothetical protein